MHSARYPAREWFALFTTKLKLLSLSLLFFASIHVRSEEFPFVNLKPSKNAKALARGVYMPLEDEAPFLKKITEKGINLWADLEMPKPSNGSEEEWKKMEQERIEREKNLIPVEDYELKRQIGEYVGWFAIVRMAEYDAVKDQTNLLIEHKYFDGATDLHLQVVSINGAGDFHVVIPGQVKESLVPPRKYGTKRSSCPSDPRKTPTTIWPRSRTDGSCQKSIEGSDEERPLAQWLEDLALARIPDSQALGGSSGAKGLA